MTTPHPAFVDRLLRSEKPAEIVHAAAACLAQMLGGFAWVRSRLSLERRTEARLEVIELMKSKYNRAGHLVSFSVVSLRVLDDELGVWRRANADLTLRRPEPVESIVCASSFLDLSSECFVVLTDPERRIAKLEQFAAHLRETALPWFGASADRRTLPSAVPDALLTPMGFAQDLMEFLVSSGQDTEARALWARVRDLNPKHLDSFAAGQRMARSSERPRWQTPEAWGWSASVLGCSVH